MKAILGLAGALLLSGCALGNRIDYQGVTPALDYNGTIVLAVATQDARPVVREKVKPATFAGLTRAAFGGVFNVTTASGRPLAEDFTAAMVRALSARGFDAQAVSIDPNAGPEAVRAALAPIGARALVLTLNEWQSDSDVSTGLLYSLGIKVVDAQGVLLASESISGRDELGRSAWNPPALARREVPIAFRDKLQQLLSFTSIVGALR